MEEAFSIRWTEFQKNLHNSFNELREEGTFFDVTLVTDEEVQVQAHKLVLSACSDFFKTILKKNPHSHPLIYLNGITSENLAYVLEYIYHGEVKISKNALYDFMKVAQLLKLRELKVDIEGGDCNTKEEEEIIQHPSDNTIKVETDNYESFEENLNPENVDKTPNVDLVDNEEVPLHFPEESDEMSDLVYEELKAEKLVNCELDPDDWDYYEDLSSNEYVHPEVPSKRKNPDKFHYAEDGALPEHSFQFRETCGREASKRGVVLFIGDRVYKKNKIIGKSGRIVFTCNGCEKEEGKYLSAIARVVDNEYKLERIPLEKNHVCVPKKHDVDVRMAMKLINEKIIEEPTRSIREIYDEVKDSYVESMGPDMRESFRDSIPKYEKISSSLTQKRKKAGIGTVRTYRPRDPNDYYSKDDPLPEHRFVFRETIGKTGSNKGVPSTKVSLYIGNRVYKKNKRLKNSDRICFNCNGCEKQGKYLSAMARLVNNEYKLERVPLEKNHVCVPTKHIADVRMAMKLINEKIIEEPTRSIRCIYDEVKDSYVESMEPDMRESFVESIPKYEKILPSLRRKRRNAGLGSYKIKPRDPNDYYSKDELLPEHQFVFRETIGISGSKKGVPSTKVVLHMDNRVYTKSKMIRKPDRMCFSCNGCLKQGKYLSVLAEVVDNEYKLYQVPKEELHVCSPEYLGLEVKMAKKLLIEKALEDPTRSITEIYREVKDSFEESLEPQDLQLFLENFPTYSQVKSLLCRKRKEQRERSATAQT